jgi:CO/xanthine dehydrogenase Mo-binding subunit
MSTDPTSATAVPDIEDHDFPEPVRYRFEMERRAFMRVFGALGGGLCVLASLPEAAAQESGRASGPDAVPQQLAAWLHIDEKGHVSVYTGKTEIGQNIRTSLAQTISDELRVPLDAVTMVMADTDLVPFDAGTFGSQTTPRMAPQLARAAATAREMLIDRAAALWRVDRTTLTVKEGRVINRDGRTVSFGELTRGQKLTGTVTADVPLLPPSQWIVRGTVARKARGRTFVTGAHQYTPDIVRPGMLHGRVIRPDTYAGTLVSLDDTRARAIKDVKVVRDGEFVGVVAPSERGAHKAAALVRAEWKRPDQHPSSATIYEYLKQHERKDAQGRGGRSSAPIEIGNVADARAGVVRAIEASYRIPYIAHVPLEPRAAVAEWAGEKLTVWTGTQRPFGVRAELAEAFRMPEDQVRVIVPDTGSAYGGKHSGEQAIEAARLAKAAGKPVKVVWTRAEEFAFGYFRPGGVIDVRAGIDANSKLVTWEFDNWNSGPAAIRTPYDVPHQRIEFHPSDSPLRQGSYRGLAATANHYVREMHMDEIARALGIDAVEFRLAYLKEPRLRDVLKAAAEKAGWPGPAAAGRALGIACGTEKGSYVAAAAELSRSGNAFKVERLIVVFECGAIVNPDGLRNQVEGAIVQGLGGALFEAVDFKDGRILNGSMAQYRVPRFKDVPTMDIVLLDRRDLPSAGAGETPIVCVAPAIGSAARRFGKVLPALPVQLASG